MMQRSYRIRLGLMALVVLLMSATVPAWAKSKKKAKKASPQPAVVAHKLSYNDSRRYAKFFLEAVRQQEAGHYAAAFDLINHCLAIDPQAADAYFLRSRYNGSLDRDSLAMADLVAAATLQPGNDTYQERLAQLYIGQGQYAKATAAYERLYAAHRDRDDVLELLIQLYQVQRDYPNALDAIGRLEQVDGYSEQIELLKMSVYERQGDEKNAYRVLKDLADSHPNDLNYSLMLGNWLMQHNGQAEAFQLYTKALAAEPDNASAQSSMYDYYQSTGNDSLARGMVERILLNPATSPNTRVQFMRQVVDNNERQGGDSTAIIRLIGRMQQTMPRDTTIAQLKAAYYSMKKLPQDSIDSALTELLSLSPDAAPVRIQLIQDKWGSENWDEIGALSEQGMLYNPNEPVFYYITGISRFYMNDDDGALDALRRGATFITQSTDPGLASDIYSMLGEIYHNKGMAPQAYAAYDSCLQWKPDNIVTLNNYAYYLSVDGKNLEKAERMSKQAIEAEPKNPTYLDTYAWVLYGLKRYADAKVYIDAALRFSPDSLTDATLYEHAADIYAGLGDYEGAISFSEKAIGRGADKKATERKINRYKALQRKKR